MEVPTGSCQVCGTGRRLKKDGTFPRHKSVYGDVCPGAGALPAPAEDKLREAIAAARERGDSSVGGLAIRLIQMQPNWGELQVEWGELERYFRALAHVFYLVDATAKYSNCRFCGKPVNDAIYAWAKRQFAPQLCGDPECARKEHIKVHGCCEKATPSNCVCTYSFTCPDHGEMHVGTHD